MTKLPQIVGVLNVTPDSFSDGSLYLQKSAALDRLAVLKAQGADIVDIGGVASGPGSVSVSLEEEWRRIADVVSEAAKILPVSVDTYRAAIAERALRSGASIINDISAASDPNMLAVIAEHKAKLVLMYSASVPHDFSHLESPKGLNVDDLIEKIERFWSQRIEAALKAGVTEQQIILDPGMGAFVSSDPEASWGLLVGYRRLSKQGFPLMLACSRKRFLKSKSSDSTEGLDGISSFVGVLIAQYLDWEGPAYLRVHNVEMQRLYLGAAG